MSCLPWTSSEFHCPGLLSWIGVLKLPFRCMLRYIYNQFL